MLDQYGRAVINPKPPAFSRTVLGPVESLASWARVEVSGELLVPTRHVAPAGYAPGGLGPAYHTFEIDRLQYRYEVQANAFRDPKFREYLEQQVRHNLVKEAMGRFTIPMHVKEVAW